MEISLKVNSQYSGIMGFTFRFPFPAGNGKIEAQKTAHWTLSSLNGE